MPWFITKETLSLGKRLKRRKTAQFHLLFKTFVGVILSNKKTFLKKEIITSVGFYLKNLIQVNPEHQY